MEQEIKKSDFVQSLEKGLNVIRVFDQDNTRMTLTEVAKRVDLTRANARRILLTLQFLGYVKSSVDGKYFSLSPKILDLGYSYLSSLGLPEIAKPYMEKLAAQVQESCSLSTNEGHDIIYIARVQTKRIMTISLGVGTRLPIHCTSMGRVIVSQMPSEEREKLMDKIELKAYSSKTITNRALWKKEIMKIKEQGWGLVDQELEEGVRSIAVPIIDSRNCTIAALNISGHASRVSVEEMINRFLPQLQDCADKINLALSKLN